MRKRKSKNGLEEKSSDRIEPAAIGSKKRGRKGGLGKGEGLIRKEKWGNKMLLD